MDEQMDQPIDGLNIEFTGDSSTAEESLEALGKALEKMREATVRVGQTLSKVDFTQFNEGIKKVAQALQPLQGFKSQAGGLITALTKVDEAVRKVASVKDFESFGRSIESLADALEPLSRVRTQLGATLDTLMNLSQVFQQVVAIAPDIDEFSKHIDALAKGLKPLGEIKSRLGSVLEQLSRFTHIVKQIDETSQHMNRFTKQITDLATSLKPLADVKVRLRTVGSQLEYFGKVLGPLDEVMSNVSVGERIGQIVSALSTLRGIEDLKTPLRTVANQLRTFVEVIPELDNVLSRSDLPALMGRLKDGLVQMKDITGVSGRSSIITQLAKLPKIATELDAVNVEKFAVAMERLAVAMRPLATEMEKVARGFSAFPSRIQRMITENERLNSSVRRSSSTFKTFQSATTSGLFRFTFSMAAVYKVTRLLGRAFDDINAYVENLHLFKLTMEDVADAGLRFAKVVQTKMGIDVSQWMRYQAVFQNMAKGFGIANDKAAIMSQTLTQLGFDLAAVFNVDYDTSMRKLESAIAGQPRPMREWGYDISQTTLKMVAQNLGIEKNVELMTQMEKSQLRFIQVMETSRKQGYLGDMARTLLTPANATRILSQEILQLTRAIGEMLIPIVLQTIPIIIAGTRVLTEFVHSLSAVVGFTMPKIDYSSVAAMRTGVSGLTDDVDDLDDAMKALKKTTMGFDELNLLGNQDMDAQLDELGLNLSAFTYDFLSDLGSKLEELTREFSDATYSIRKNLLSFAGFLKEHAPVVKTALGALSVALARGLLGPSLARGGALGGLSQNLNLGLTVSGAILSFGSGMKFSVEGFTASTFGEALMKGLVSTGGALWLLGATPQGWAVGLGLTLVANLVGFLWGKKSQVEEEVRKALYDGKGSMSLKNVLLSLDDPKIDKMKIGSLDELTQTTSSYLDAVLGGSGEFQQAGQRIDTLGDSIRKTNTEIERVQKLWEAGALGVDTYQARVETLVHHLTTDLMDQVSTSLDVVLGALGGTIGKAIERPEELMQAVQQAAKDREGMIEEFAQLVKVGIFNERRQELEDALIGSQRQLVEQFDKRMSELDMTFKGPDDAKAFWDEFSQGMEETVSGIHAVIQELGSALEVFRSTASQKERGVLEKYIGELAGIEHAMLVHLGEVEAGIKGKYLEALQRQFGKEALTKGKTPGATFIKEASILAEMGGVEEGFERFISQFKLLTKDKGFLAQFNKAAASGQDVGSFVNDMYLKKVFTPGEYGPVKPIDTPEAILDRLLERQLRGEKVEGLMDIARGGGLDREYEHLASSMNLLQVHLKQVLGLVQSKGLSLEGFVGGFERDVRDVGLATALGFLEGLEKELVRGGGKAFGAVLQAIKDRYEIHSPSLVFLREVGIPAAQGILEGLETGLDSAQLQEILDRVVADLGAIDLGALTPELLKGSFLEAGLSIDSSALDEMVGNIMTLREEFNRGGFDALNIVTGGEGTVGAPTALGSEERAEEIDRFNREVVSGLMRLQEGVSESAIDDMIFARLDKGMMTSFGHVSTQADSTVKSVVGTFFNGTKKIMADWEGTAEFYRDGLAIPILDETSSLLGQSLNMYKRDHDLRKMGWSDFVEWLKGNPLKNMGKYMGDSIQKIGEKFSSHMGDMILQVTGLEEAFKNAKAPIIGVIEDIIRELVRMAAQKAFIFIATKILDASGIPATAITQILGGGFAAGGFPDQGSLFVARESGPEMVGTIGGRTAVANNDQIVKAVSTGVYEAVTAAMSGLTRGNERPIEVRVTLDGKEITRAVERHQRDRGIDILPSGGMAYGY